MKYYDGEGSDRIELTPLAGGKDCLGNGEHEGIEIRVTFLCYAQKLCL